MGQVLSGILGTDSFVVVVVEGVACAGQFPNKFSAEQKPREKKYCKGSHAWEKIEQLMFANKVLIMYYYYYYYYYL